MFFEDLKTYHDRICDNNDILDRLMSRRVRNILFVAPLYDAYILQQEANLGEQILNEYKQLNLSTVPKVTTVPSGLQALELLATRNFDLCITTLRVGSYNAFELAAEMKDICPELPLLLLLNSEADLAWIIEEKKVLSIFDDVFFWTGDSKLFLAILKSVEDRLNVYSDVAEGFVRVILLVEDNVRYYSQFLPLLYSEIVKQTQQMMGSEYTLGQKTLRMRARPKVLMAHTYEDAVDLYEKCKEHLLCVISDVNFPRDGAIKPKAGIDFISRVREHNSTIPVVLQSTETVHWEEAHRLKSTFLYKHSDNLLKGLKTFLLENCGFGDFVFRGRDGLSIDRASSVAELAGKIQHVPLDSILYHSNNNHFSAWLVAHGEIQMARRLEPMRKEDFSSPAALREYLSNLFEHLRSRRTRGRIVEYETGSRLPDGAVVRLGGGSLGGKGRGLAFLNALVSSTKKGNRIDDRSAEDVNIQVPRTAIVGTDEYDFFIENNHFPDFAGMDDERIRGFFLKGELSSDLKRKIQGYLSVVKVPVAVRSSSLLEDSHSRPFAGIYSTYMLANSEDSLLTRVDILCRAIKLVYASVFLAEARGYIESIQYAVEQEKMAVVIQEISGARHGDYFFPEIAGVAESLDFYPQQGCAQSDGVASICLGLGKYVVDGSSAVRFCPRYPTKTSRLSDEMPKNSQKKLFVLRMNRDILAEETMSEDTCVELISIREADKLGVLDSVASTWDNESGCLVPGTMVKGPRVITFEDILYNDLFPLAPLIDDFLKFGELALGVPVQIEFAADLGSRSISLLQIRPLVRLASKVHISEEERSLDHRFLLSKEVMGNGIIENITDIIYVDPEKFNNLETLEMKDTISRYNEVCRREKRDYLLIGPGRWGTRDRFLGIPVMWHDISMVKAIVELRIPGFPAEPSQGSHFFHNLVAMNLGYFAVDLVAHPGHMDVEWVKGLQEVTHQGAVTHYRCETPVTIKMDGTNQIAVISRGNLIDQ